MNKQFIPIREGRPEDASIIAEYNQRMALETEGKELDSKTVTQGVLQGLLQPDKCRYFVAEAQGSVIGQAMVTYEWSDWRNGDLWWIQSVYVHPGHRRQGVFTQLYRHIETLARNNGNVRGLRLYVEEENAAGQAVYQKLGMSHAGYHVYEREF
ncbi:MAG: GNAT family N-acetyltransferase [Nitrospinota bacterium]|nr:GNAT family N-acetyltransferase [Nitrospinota bacterium]